MSSKIHSAVDLATEIKPTTGDIPPPLVGASTTIVENKMYLFGGRLLDTKEIVNHLYILDLDSLIWTLHLPKSASEPASRPRFFHSANLFNKTLIVFGGMSYSTKKFSKSLRVLNDICFLNLETLTWNSPIIHKSGIEPKARYAHLSVCSKNKLLVVGGQDMSDQDMSNKYIDEINVFDIKELKWIKKWTLNKDYSAYRSIAFSPSPFGTDSRSSPPFWENNQLDKKGVPLCIYSNYNFTNVKRELQSCYPLSSAELKDHSANMKGTSFPSGLRSPSAHLLGHHMILTGIYLTPKWHSFHTWALNLKNLVWVRIDTGSVLSQGSWNKGVLHPTKQKLLVFGDKTRDVSSDYSYRQTNYNYVAAIELEAFGIYTHPKETCAPLAQELGLGILNEPSMADIEIVTSDERSIPANSSVIGLRWNHFNDLLSENPDNPGFKRLTFSENYHVTLAFLQFLYADHLMTAQQHEPYILSRLLLLSDIYNIPRLGSLAAHALHQTLNADTSCMIYKTAALTGRTPLQIRALRVMIDTKKKLQLQPNQTDISDLMDDLPSIISSSYSETTIRDNLSMSSQDSIKDGAKLKASTSTPAPRQARVINYSSSSSSDTRNLYTGKPIPKSSKSNHILYQRTKLTPLVEKQKEEGSALPPLNISSNSSHKHNPQLGMTLALKTFEQPKLGFRL